ncbi:MAG: hypothetical protein WBE03_04390, partial [Terracidiphilus sp.]
AATAAVAAVASTVVAAVASMVEAAATAAADAGKFRQPVRNEKPALLRQSGLFHAPEAEPKKLSPSGTDRQWVARTGRRLFFAGFLFAHEQKHNASEHEQGRESPNECDLLVIRHFIPQFARPSFEGRILAFNAVVKVE